MKKYFVYRYSYGLSLSFHGLPWYSKKLEDFTPIGYNKRARKEFGETTEFVTEYSILRKLKGGGENTTIILSVGVADLKEWYEDLYPQAVVWVYEI